MPINISTAKEYVFIEMYIYMKYYFCPKYHLRTCDQ